MDTVLGLIGMLVYMVAVLGLASGVTWLVVKISPASSAKKPKPESA
jgi:flagellar biogenesis protein FliO